MEVTERTAIWNPFHLDDRNHFPSFTEAFGEMLKIEAERMEKACNSKATSISTSMETSKSNSNCTTPNTLNNGMKSKSNSKSKSKSNSNINPYSALTPIPNKSKFKKFELFSNNNIDNDQLSPFTTPITPIPTKSHCNISNIPNISNISNITNNTKQQIQTMKYGGICTPIPNKTTFKKTIQSNNNNNNNNNNENLSIIITPAPKKNKKKITRTKSTKNNEESILMIDDIMSPQQHRYETSSPAPNDKNAHYISQPAVDFPIILPPTPCIRPKNKKRNQLEEKWCNDFFAKHKPLLTPMKKRENPYKLYNPSDDENITMLLENSDTPYDEETEHRVSTETNPMELYGNISMIISSKDNNNNKKKMKNKKKKKNKKKMDKPPIIHNNNNNNNNKKKTEPSFLCSFGNSFALNMNLTKSVILTPSSVVSDGDNVNKKDKSMINTPDIFGSNPPSDIKPKKIKQKIDEKKVVINEQETECKSFERSISEIPETPKITENININKLNAEFSDIKLNKTKQKRKNDDNDNIIKDVDDDIIYGVLSDDEFFKLETTEKLDKCSKKVRPFDNSNIFNPKCNNNKREDQSTQTLPVLVFGEDDIPKIRFNGKLLSDYNGMSMSAINYNEYHKMDDMNTSNTSIHSAQSDQIIYKGLYTQPLRHNQDSINLLNDDLSSISGSDINSDNDNEHGEKMKDVILNNSSKSNECWKVQIIENNKDINKENIYRNRYNNKYQGRGNKMLREYKQSKLAQNPNWTICNAHNKKGELM